MSSERECQCGHLDHQHQPATCREDCECEDFAVAADDERMGDGVDPAEWQDKPLSRWENPVSDELREALIEAAIAWKREDQPDKPLAVVKRWAEWFIDAALAAAPAPETLDVERLALSMDACLPDAFNLARPGNRVRARAIAREYAALTPTTPEKP